MNRKWKKAPQPRVLAGKKYGAQQIQRVDVLVRGEGRAQTRFAVFCLGAKNAPPLFLLHGVPDSHVAMVPTMIYAANLGYRVFAPDMPGLGASPPYASQKHYDLELLAQHYLQLFYQLSAGSPVRVVGHDWGGFIVLACTLCEPEAFVFDKKNPGVVVFGTPHPIDFRQQMKVPAQAAKSKYIEALTIPRVGEKLVRSMGFVKAALRHGAFNPERVSDQLLEEKLRLMQQPGTAKAVTRYYRAYVFKKVRSTKVPKSLVPTRVYLARHDAAHDFETLAASFRSKKRFVYCDLRELKGSGHYPNIDLEEFSRLAVGEKLGRAKKIV